jgi:hypothetical protein
MSGRRALTCGLLAGAAIAAAIAPAASASPLDPSGVLRIVKRAHVQLNTNQSSNWFGYNAGALERGSLFNSITSDWAVPTASQHTSGQAESSATWIGIGGGCVDAGCGLSDATLIQTGTEQDVDASGHASYSAWWELVPAPAVTISNFAVSPGDHLQASIAEKVADSELWTITLRDVTKNESFSTTVPYTSTHSSAEWIEETPLTIGSGGTGEASLPNLTPTQFTSATINGSAARLNPAEELQLIDSAGKVIGTPSAPNAAATGFNACAWATACAVPSNKAAAPVKSAKPGPAKKKRPARKKRHRRRHHRARHKHSKTHHRR